MVVSQKRSKRKASGAQYKATLAKRLDQKGGLPVSTGIGAKRVRVVGTKGGSEKNRLLSTDVVNVYNAAKKKHVQAKIKTVSDNAANRHFIRRNIITRGAVIETDIGKVKITNRPGQEGALNGVLV